MSVTKGHAADTSVQRCVEAIRRMIVVGELLPGEPLRQVALAERLGLSRIPVREALGMLEAEGVVTYTPRVGHSVVRFNSADVSELCLMRRLLEDELLKTVDLAAVNTDYLHEINEELARVSTSELWDRKRLNHEFHFHIFEHSPLVVVRGEVQRLWNRYDMYRSLYAYQPDTLRRIVAEHRRIIAAVRLGDRAELLVAADAHRHKAKENIVERLGPPPADRVLARDGDDDPDT